MTILEKRIETIRLLQNLKRGDEKPGSIILRSLRLADAVHQKEGSVVALSYAIKCRYPNDLAFANSGFTLGVARCVVDFLNDALEKEIA